MKTKKTLVVIISVALFGIACIGAIATAIPQSGPQPEWAPQPTDLFVIPATPHDGWTFHEVHPLKEFPFVIWVRQPRNPDPHYRPMPKEVPALAKWMDEHPCPEPSDGNPLGSNAIGWRDMTVDGGYTWCQDRIGYLTKQDSPRPAKEKQ